MPQSPCVENEKQLQADKDQNLLWLEADRDAGRDAKRTSLYDPQVLSSPRCPCNHIGEDQDSHQLFSLAEIRIAKWKTGELQKFSGNQGSPEKR
jgi:hypothetical protein